MAMMPFFLRLRGSAPLRHPNRFSQSQHAEAPPRESEQQAGLGREKGPNTGDSPLPGLVGVVGFDAAVGLRKGRRKRGKSRGEKTMLRLDFQTVVDVGVGRRCVGRRLWRGKETKPRVGTAACC